MPKEKISVEIKDTGDWERYLPRPIVVVTTVSREGIPNAAPKSWVTPAVGNPSMIIFCCTKEHDTAKNTVETGEFVVNVPGEDIARQVAIMAKQYPYGVNEIEEAGLTAIPSEKVRAPRIEECRAHLECVLEDVHQKYGPEAVFIGRVVCASFDKELLEAPDERYGKGWLMFDMVEQYGLITDVKASPWQGVEG